MDKKYTCDWYNEEKTIILVRSLERSWGWDEATEAIHDQIALAESVDHPVNIIFHFEERPAMPVEGALKTLEKLMSMRAKNEALSVFVNINVIFKTLLNNAGKIYRFGDLLAMYRFVDTIEEALAEIEKYEAQQNHPE